MTVPRGEVRTCAEAMNYRLWDEWLWTTAAPISELRVMACQQEFPACRGRMTACRPEQALTITIVQPFFHRGMVHPAGGSEQGNRSGF